MPRSAKQGPGRRHGASRPQCPVCQDLIPGLWNFIDASELEERKDIGTCQHCRLVATAIEAFWPLSSLSSVALEFWRHDRHARGQPRDALIMLPCDENGPVGEEGSTRTYIEVFTTRPQTPWPWISRPRKIEQNALSDSCIDLARSWLERCLSSHSKCAQLGAAPGTWLPTRLIDVGDGTSGPKLVVSSSITDHSTKNSYVALSHCWGKEQPLRLLMGNITEFELSIAQDLLPQTFRDVVTVVRRLGMRHVWIDSLCIIQDSSADWAHEATLMGDVYQNAVVTIVADAGKDAFAGLSSSDGRSEWRQHELHTEGSQHFARRFSHPTYNNDRMDNHLATHGPSGNETTWVESRAWTYQERLLSTRKLYFGAHEVGWECSESRDCECCKGFVADYEAIDKVVQRKVFDFGAGLDSDDPVALWKELVENFTTRDMSFKSDVLPAVTGLASVIGRRAGLTYLAGMWKEGLSSMLLWAVQAPSADSGHEEYYAPSWSWASKVQMGLRSDQRYGLNIEFMPQFDDGGKFFSVPGFQILDASCNYPEANVLLPPVDGHIDIVGTVARLEKSRDHTHEGEDPYVFPGPEMDVRIFLPDTSEQDLGSVREEYAQGITHLFLPIKASIAKRTAAYPPKEVLLLLGLVIRGSARVPGAFERVGYLECLCNKNVMANFPTYVEAVRELRIV